MTNYSVEELEKLNIYEVRFLARMCGISSPTSKKKDELIAGILAYNGTDVVLPQKLGRPAKPFMLAEETFSQKGVNILNNSKWDCSNIVFRSSITNYNVEQTTFCGYLAQTQNTYCLIAFSNPLGVEMTTFISKFTVKKYNLQLGDYCVLEIKNTDIGPSEVLLSVNDNQSVLDRVPYIALKPSFDKPLILNSNLVQDGSLCEIRAGDKALVYIEKQEDICSVAKNIASNVGKIEIVLLLLNATPDLVNKALEINNVRLFFALFSDAYEKQKYIYDIALEYCKSCVVLGKNIIFVVSTFDDLEGLKGENSNNEPIMIKDLLSQALCTQNGSLTILGSLYKNDSQVVAPIIKFFDVVESGN